MPIPPGQPDPRKSSSGVWSSLPPIGEYAFNSVGRRDETHGTGAPSRLHSGASDHRRDDRHSLPTDIGQDRTRTCSIREGRVFRKQIVVDIGLRRCVVTRTAARRADRSDRAPVALSGDRLSRLVFSLTTIDDLRGKCRTSGETFLHPGTPSRRFYDCATTSAVPC